MRFIHLVIREVFHFQLIYNDSGCAQMVDFCEDGCNISYFIFIFAKKIHISIM